MNRIATLAPVGPALAVAAMVAPALGQDLDASKVVRPDGTSRLEAPVDELVAKGERLFADTALSGDGSVACTTCHSDTTGYNDTFLAPYPHRVAMATNMAGLDEITAETMVQLCMVVPMGAEPLPWESEELAALTAYVEDEQQRYAASR